MTTDELLVFAKSYNKNDFDKIQFEWNGKHGEEFDDQNYDFRMQLCELIKEDFSFSPDQLIIDLYLELSKCAEQTFGVYHSFHLFANELLKRGGSKYYDVYAEGASKSMDTGISSGRLNLSKERIDEILTYINLLELKPNSKKSRRNSYMLERFEWLKSQLNNQ